VTAAKMQNRLQPSQHADIGPTLLPARQTSALAGEHWLNIGSMSENGLANGWQLVGCNAPNNSPKYMKKLKLINRQ